MVKIKQEQLAERMFQKYSYILTRDICFGLAEDILNLTDSDYGQKYCRPLLEWIHGKTIFTDIVYNGFSLVELATWLDEGSPNIPVASLLLMLEEEGGEYRAISAVAGERCIADPRVIDGTAACNTIGKDNGIWFFMLDDSTPDFLREYQTWQVLVLNPALTFQVAYEHLDGTAMFMNEDGRYVIVPPAGGE